MEFMMAHPRRSKLTSMSAIDSGLLNTVNSLHEPIKGNAHVPFRDSKLTELLHPALSGNGKTLMMLNLSPLESSLSESISSLRFGTNVNRLVVSACDSIVRKG